MEALRKRLASIGDEFKDTATLFGEREAGTGITLDEFLGLVQAFILAFKKARSDNERERMMAEKRRKKEEADKKMAEEKAARKAAKEAKAAEEAARQASVDAALSAPLSPTEAPASLSQKSHSAIAMRLLNKGTTKTAPTGNKAKGGMQAAMASLRAGKAFGRNRGSLQDVFDTKN